MYSKNLADFSEEQFDIQYKKILKKHVINYYTVANPYNAIILGGQPGAGKSSLNKRILAEDANIIVINGDDYREFHPNFEAIDKAFGRNSVDHTQAFADAVVKRLVYELSDKKYNLVIEGTLRTAEVPLKVCRLLKNKGYNVELFVMAVNKEMSWQGTINRYEEMKSIGEIPRATSKEFHDLVVASIPKNLEEIYKSGEFDRITLYNRSLTCLYDSKKTPYLNPKKIMQAALDGTS